MGSISGLKSNLLLVQSVHLQYTGSKPKRKWFTLYEIFLINTIAKETQIQVLWFHCWGLINNPLVMSHKFE